MSADTTGLKFSMAPADISIDEQDGIIELVIEKILGYKNVIKEYENTTGQEQGIEKGVKLVFDMATFVLSKLTFSTYQSQKEIAFKTNADISSGYLDFDAPPPKG